jgi:hypothetical protein
MTYLKADGETVMQFPFAIGQLKTENPNMSFPRELPAELLAQYNMFTVAYEASPDIDDRTQIRNLADVPTRAADGSWTLGWVVTDKSSEEIASYDDAQSRSVRLQRNRLLQETDWMALSDSTMTTEWATYRQYLRDVTSQTNFPYNGNWPTKPESTT